MYDLWRSIYQNHRWLRLRKWLSFNILHLLSRKVSSVATHLFSSVNHSFQPLVSFVEIIRIGFSYPTWSIALCALFLTIVDLISRFSSLLDSVLFLYFFCFAIVHNTIWVQLRHLIRLRQIIRKSYQPLCVKIGNNSSLSVYINIFELLYSWIPYLIG